MRRITVGAVAVAIASFSASAEAAPLARGFGVVALDGAKDPASQLARAVYGRPSLRPDASLDEARAQVLIGEPAPPNFTDVAARKAAKVATGSPPPQRACSAGSSARRKGFEASSRAMLVGTVGRPYARQWSTRAA